MNQHSYDLSPWTRHLKGQRVLITGSTGYIGTTLSAAFRAAGSKTIRLLRPTSASVDGQHELVIRGPLHATETWKEALSHEPELILHLAGQTSVPVAAADPLKDWEANVAPVVQLIQVCTAQGLRPRVVLAGTATAGGVPFTLPARTPDNEDPLTIYDLHKLTAERYLRQAVRDGVLSGATLRLANVYGPGPPTSRPDRGILNVMIQRAAKGLPLTVYGAGAFLRDYIFVDDVVRAFAALAGSPANAADGRPYFVSTGVGTMLVDAFRLVARTVGELTGRSVQVEHVEPPQPLFGVDARDFVGDPRPLLQECGWAPLVPLKEGIARTARHVLEHPLAEVP